MLERVRDDFITQGYAIKSEGETGVLMIKHPWDPRLGGLLRFYRAAYRAMVSAYFYHSPRRVCAIFTLHRTGSNDRIDNQK